MSSNRRPWYPWYPKDFNVDEKVQALSADGELVYRRALDVMWQANDCQLPSNCLRLANALSKGLTKQEFEDAWSEIQFKGSELFKTSECGEWIYSSRLKKEAQKIENISNLRSKLGKKGAMAKAKAIAKQKPKQSSGHPDPDPDIIKKAKAFSSDSAEYRLSKYLFEHIRRNNQKAKEPNLQLWSMHVDKMIRIDKRSVEDIKTIIEWCQKDSFWSSNILSTQKLRKQFDQLWAKMNVSGSDDNLNPRTYSQCQDAEERELARWLNKQEEACNGGPETDPKGTGQLVCGVGEAEADRDD